MKGKTTAFSNWILTLSNGVAFAAAYFCFSGGRQPLLGVLVTLSGLASVLFHSCEQHKHPVLPGLWSVTASEEALYLNVDRAAALATGISVWYLVGAGTLLRNPLVWAALACNLLSELHYLGVVSSPRWDAHVYPALHSVWHVLVFTIPIAVVNGV